MTRPTLSRIRLFAGATSFVVCAAQLARAQSPCAHDASIATPAATDSATAQPTPNAPTHAAADSASSGSVAVRILAAASAREVRFNAQPQIHVQLCGALDSVHVLDRRNLPTPVVVGTTYRNVYVAVEIFGRVHADCIARRITGADTSRGGPVDCASLDVQSTASPRPPSDTTRPPRR